VHLPRVLQWSHAVVEKMEVRCGIIEFLQEAFRCSTIIVALNGVDVRHAVIEEEALQERNEIAANEVVLSSDELGSIVPFACAKASAWCQIPGDENRRDPPHIGDSQQKLVQKKVPVEVGYRECVHGIA